MSTAKRLAEGVEEEESEYETDSEEIIVKGMVKAIYVPRAARETIAERQRLEAEKARKKLVQRTEQVGVEEFQKEEENLEMEASNADVDTDDDEAEEYGAWTVREIGRINWPRDAILEYETGEDEMDESVLAKVMEVKHFGRTKWNHLVDEDTTNWNSPWSCYEALCARYNAKMARINPKEGRS